MSIQRFFIPEDCIRTDEVILPQDVQHQLGRVLRMQAGEHIIVLDGRGAELLLELQGSPPHNFTAKILSKQPCQAEPRFDLHLYVALTQREKFEWILQKTTEVGVAALQPLICARSLVQERASFASKRQRWEKILREAAEQCGRGRVPRLEEPLGLEPALAHAQQNESIMLVAWEAESTKGLKQVLSSRPQEEWAAHPLALFIGPEGGFETGEIERMRAAGAFTFSLGARILRMETAAILAPALLLFELGDLG